MDYETILYEKIGHKGVVTLNRPEALNAFTAQMQEELVSLYLDIKKDRDIWVIIITGAGERAFCSGADVRGGPASDPLESNASRRVGFDPGTKLMPKNSDVYIPTITAVNGICAAGGFYFVGFADIVICSDNAAFTEPHSSNGLTPIVEPLLLARRGVPFTWVMRLGLLGRHERWNAQRALELGLVTEVVPQAKLMERAHELADLICLNAPIANQGMVKGVWQAMDMGLTSGMQHAHDLAQMYNDISGESTEGIQAFLAKRQPDWEKVAREMADKGS